MATNVAEKPEVAPEPTTKAAVKLALKEPHLEENYRKRLWVDAPAGCTKLDLQHPDFWAPVARWLRRHDIVTVMNELDGWEIEVRIEAVRPSGADVTISKAYSRIPLSAAQKWLDAEHYTQWRPGESWCVIRGKDECVLIRGHGTEGGAVNQFYDTRPKAA